MCELEKEERDCGCELERERSLATLNSEDMDLDNVQRMKQAVYKA
jgi:hypothetical protein